MTISGRTKIVGLFGYPVEHTFSPAMQNAAFGHLSIDYCYLPFSVHPGSLKQAVDSIKALNFAGVNVTVPHKEAVIPLLDDVNEEASFIGAVNTVVNTGGILSGYNTDGRGFMRSLAESHVDNQGMHILIVGSGGACRAVSYYLTEKAASVSIYDIDSNKLSKLVSDLSLIRSNVTALDSIGMISEYDMIINATPLGLRKGDSLPVDISVLRPEQTVCDLIYKRTPLLQAAADKGCKTVDGLGMLLWQGAYAFELWTGFEPPVEIMRSALLSVAV